MNDIKQIQQKGFFGAYKSKTQERYNNMQSSYNTLPAKHGRLVNRFLRSKRPNGETLCDAYWISKTNKSTNRK